MDEGGCSQEKKKAITKYEYCTELIFLWEILKEKKKFPLANIDQGRPKLLAPTIMWFGRTSILKMALFIVNCSDLCAIF